MLNNHTIVDAAYEGAVKRTFLAMLLLVAMYLPLLVGIIILYRILGNKPTGSAFEDTKNVDSNTEEELDKLVSNDNIDNFSG